MEIVGLRGTGGTRLRKLFRAIARGRYAVVGSGRPHYHLVYIEDLLDGYELALTHPASRVPTSAAQPKRLPCTYDLPWP